jgi:AraC-like DNA-binding protein
MNNYFKYLPFNPDDSVWGFYLTVAGGTTVEPDSNYPPAKHPTGYHFSWNNGRILQEFQINYITGGEGIMETKEGQFPIKEGSIIILHPNVWHRYKPLKYKGWTEHYVGYSGEMAYKIMGASEHFSQTGVLQIGMNENILNLFNQIVNNVREEKPGFQQICSGLLIQILGQIISIKKSVEFKHDHTERAIQKACTLIHDNQTKNLNIEALAESLNINYSLFRKVFKKYTGLSPLQYHTSLRMKQAIYLLTNTNQSVKEISYNLGFCSVFYFSKLFKEKTNQTPIEYRKAVNRTT